MNTGMNTYEMNYLFNEYTCYKLVLVTYLTNKHQV